MYDYFEWIECVDALLITCHYSYLIFIPTDQMLLLVH